VPDLICRGSVNSITFRLYLSHLRDDLSRPAVPWDWPDVDDDEIVRLEPLAHNPKAINDLPRLTTAACTTLSGPTGIDLSRLVGHDCRYGDQQGVHIATEPWMRANSPGCNNWSLVSRTAAATQSADRV